MLKKRWEELRDWTYDNYHWAYAAGTFCITQSLFFPSKTVGLVSWLGCLAAGAALEPCVNPYRQLYGKHLWRGPKDQHWVALTFDDGPDLDTPALLELLRKYNVKASFFCIGQQVEARPALAKLIHEEGHLVCNHTYSHANLLTCNPAQTREELVRAQQVIVEATGQAPRYWRAPFGYRAPWTYRIAESLGLKAVSWSVNPRDFHDPGAEVIVQRCLEPLQPGVIWLLHDGLGHRPQTLEATAQIIEKALERGYEFVRLDRMDVG